MYAYAMYISDSLTVLNVHMYLIHVSHTSFEVKRLILRANKQTNSVGHFN